METITKKLWDIDEALEKKNKEEYIVLFLERIVVLMKMFPAFWKTNNSKYIAKRKEKIEINIVWDDKTLRKLKRWRR